MAKNRKKKQGGEPQNKQSGAVVGAAGDDWLTPEVLGSMRAKELKQVLEDRGISSDDLEKKDLIDKILRARDAPVALRGGSLSPRFVRVWPRLLRGSAIHR